ncbi:DUF300-domain-containing protein [Sanghuangporus baumii]|uniref:DUF300-domain-containing protein n=1 Tax=Sanghuangporus baumii TaxID=108892 RepID=A0A9Q5I217_SANBA|nr:DUF300-domain-containing protein [Sanghuangporus baumii]
MPPVYAIISFFSYRFFRSYTYYELIEVVYEALTLSAFMLLIIEYVAATATDHSASKALERKDKLKLPFPVAPVPSMLLAISTHKGLFLVYYEVASAAIRHHPSTDKTVVSIAGIICQAYNVLCESEGFTHFEYAYPYLSIVDFITISCKTSRLSLYGLFVFYGLTKDELKGQRPLAKFMCIKLIVIFTFYQSFVFEALEGRVIKGTAYWTETNIANGLNALAICIEMVFFALAMIWAYPATPYKKGIRTGIGRPLLDSLNFSDFAAEIWGSLKFFIDYMRGKPGARTPKRGKPNLAQAFGIEGTELFSYSQQRLPTSMSDASGYGYGYTPSASEIPMMGNKAGVRGVARTRYGYPEPGAGIEGSPDPSLQGRGRDASLDQSGENVRLTTFAPRNSIAGVYHRESDETTAEGASYPQASYPASSQSGRRQY